ncbi:MULTISPECIES: TetR/AcrR family transcriptional regulator [Brevundimonas]|uniref:Rut operon repressor n=1 Tax=Brevundimonas vancanneytii TaxID=1325724 RepID=A0A4P1KCC8_9CAUL|nr:MULTISPECIES: TetR/AcrR family transcriptional regulator [Brevundimonas]QBQ49593.1 TetR/AcrR family transcriptional regulator [Brevundimonas naejangsanensis]VTO17119.1 Rut operon repressor [Brevundimonas vancanneytii]
MVQSESPWKPKQDRSKERDAKREAVLFAAASAFNENGFHNTSLDDIAVRLNVSKPTVYYYGASKEALLSACYLAALSLLDDVTQRTGPQTATGESRLWVLIVAYAEAILSVYGRCLTRVPDNSLSAPLREEVRRLKRTVDDRIRSVLSDGASDGSLRPTDSKLTAFAIAGALNAAALWFEDDGPRSPRQIGEHYADLFTNALRST